MDSSILNLDTFTDANRSFLLKIENRMAHRVDPDETANYEMKGLKPDQISGPFIYHIFRSIQKPKFFTSKT